jgi:acetyl esterase/lipase
VTLSNLLQQNIFEAICSNIACMRLRTSLLLLLLAAPALAQQHTMLLWPNGNPEPSKVVGPETDPTTDANRIVSGKVAIRVTNVSKPNLAVYSPDAAKNTGAAALVFPGGSYIRLSYSVEGTEVCDWLNSVGMTCILVKYRVPEEGHYPDNVEDLEDAQTAMRLTREHAAEWHIDPNRIGAIGFSAGAHLAVVLSTHPDFQGKGIPASTVDARPNFQMVIYPGWLGGSDGKVNPSVKPTPELPPTFLVQAENDYTAHVENALIYFQALKDAKIPAELHLFTEGGHGFGLRPTELPISRWPALAEAWLHTIHILGPPGPVGRP